MTDTRFDVTLDDGRIAHCWQALEQPYEGARFSAGLVEGIDPDAFYLRLERGEGTTTIFLRRDEALALAWLLTGALWSGDMMGSEDGPDV